MSSLRPLTFVLSERNGGEAHDGNTWTEIKKIKRKYKKYQPKKKKRK